MHLFVRNQLDLVSCTINSLAGPRYSYVQRRVVGSRYCDLSSRCQFQLIQLLALLSQHEPVMLLGNTNHRLGLNATIQYIIFVW